MGEKIKNVTITQLILSAALICFWSWFIFAVIEMVTRLLKGSSPWPFMILFTLLLYSGVGLAMGGILGGIIGLILKVVKKWQQRVTTILLIMSLCISMLVFLYTGLFIRERFLPLYPQLSPVLINLTFGVFSLIILITLYMSLVRIVDKTRLITSYLALSLTLYTFMIGGLYINEQVLTGKFLELSAVRVLTNSAIIISSVILYILIYSVFIFMGKSAGRVLRTIPFRTMMAIVIILLAAGGTTLYIKARSPLKEPVVETSGQREDKPNIILITMDTTRADHLSCYGYHKNTTPNLDTLAKESMLFKNAYATSPWTLPSHASIFTGMYPTRHSAHFAWEETKADPPKVLGKQHKTLAEILFDVGYRTAGVIGGPFCRSIFGLAQGFEYYDDALINVLPDLRYFTLFNILSRWIPLEDVAARQGLNGCRIASQMNTRVFSWLEEHYQYPFFLFINYFDPHSPYLPPDQFSHLFGKDENYDSLSQYNGEIAYLDYQMGKLFEKLKKLKIYNNTVIIITSDHGVFLGERGFWGHGYRLYEEVIKIPLIIKYPSSHSKIGVYRGRVSLVDITPTILNLLGLPISKGIQGVDLFEENNMVMAEVYKHRSKRGGFFRGWQSLYLGNYKYIKGKKGEDELYDIVDDPRELHNLIDTIPKEAKEMELKLTEWLSYDESYISKGELPELDETTKESLGALGYLVND